MTEIERRVNETYRAWAAAQDAYCAEIVRVYGRGATPLDDERVSRTSLLARLRVEYRIAQEAFHNASLEYRRADATDMVTERYTFTY